MNQSNLSRLLGIGYPILLGGMARISDPIFTAAVSEAGGLGTLALTPQVVDAVNIPVIAAGGICDARGYLAARILGAEGVSLGTMFLASKECRKIGAGYREQLMASPKLMLMDEPSMGLSPLLVGEIFKIIRRINREEGVSILLVEQNARLALSIADHGYVMENGRIVLDDSVEKIKDNADIKEFYLGLTEVGKKKSYRDIKHYKRRKRWLT
jgi:hypothetical protein